MSDIIYLEKSDIGATLTTWIYCSFWQQFAAEALGLRSYINWPRDPRRALRNHYDEAKFNEMPNMYDWYFVQPMVSAAELPPREQCRVWEWEKGAELPDLAKAQGDKNLYGNVSFIKTYYKKHLKFNDMVNARGQALVQKYGIDFRNTIGVTWRGTDSIIDGRPRLPIETYFPFIDDILASSRACPDCGGEKEHHSIVTNGMIACLACHGSGSVSNRDLRIMCTAEEESIIDPLLARYPNAFKIQEFFSTPLGRNTLGDNPERFSTLPGFERGMQPALMVWLFSKCAYYIKNRASTAAVASWLSDGKIVSLAHPENLGHDPESRNWAEIEGKRVPLFR